MPILFFSTGSLNRFCCFIQRKSDAQDPREALCVGFFSGFITVHGSYAIHNYPGLCCLWDPFPEVLRPEDLPSEDLPSEDLLPEDLPSEDLLSEDLPLEDLASEDLSLEVL